MSLNLRPLSPAFGAEVIGLDLAKPMSEATFGALEDAFNTYSLLLLRDQDLSEDEHVAVSGRFGELQDHVLKSYMSDANSKLLVLSNIQEGGKAAGIADAGQIWHADTSYNATPCRCSLLLGREIPEPDGERTFGDTIFLSAVSAYKALSEEKKRALEGLTAPHSYIQYYKSKQAAGSVRPNLTKEQEAEVPEVVHPVVLPHPITGEKAIFVNRGYTMRINGLPTDESDRLLEELFDHLTQPEFVYRHKWRPGDLIIWDNYATQHSAVGDYALPKRRLMHRTTVLLGKDAEQELARSRGDLAA